MRLPSLDIHTIGAGGGSIARLDAGGALRVGPESAGADARSRLLRPRRRRADGDRRRPRARAHPGRRRVPRPRPARRRRGAQRRSTARASRPTACVAVVDAAMEQAVRAVTVERGVDPRDLALVAFGGAGPLHACAVAEALGMRAVIVPPRAGVLSAVGLLCSPRAARAGAVVARRRATTTASTRRCDRARPTKPAALVGGARRSTVETAASTAATPDRATSSRSPTVDDFPAEHERRNGYARPGAPVEVVALRGDGSAARAAVARPTSRPSHGRAVGGPAVVAEADCTVWVPDGWRADARPPRRVGAGAR